MKLLIFNEKGIKLKGMIARLIIGLLCIIIISLLVFIVAVAFTSKGEIENFTDDSGNVIKGSIAERTFIDVNGKRNGLIIRSRNEDNPVLLFISGGPGVPEYWLNDAYKKQYLNKLEDEFTVCWWDYIGEGLSYDKSVNPEEITLEKLTEDAVVVTDYLKERFGVTKVYLMAHSGGTMLGMNLAKEHPELFYCYFAMGQVNNPGYDRHEAGYNYMKTYFEEIKDEKNLRKLESLVDKSGEHITLNNKYHDGHWEQMLLAAGCGTTRDMRSDVTGIFFPQMFSHCYTFKEKINYWLGKSLLSKSPYSNESKRVYENMQIDIPVVFLSGKYDYTTPIEDARLLYEMIESEDKAFYEFSNSAHSPLWEENEEVLEVMKKYVDE